MPRLYTPLRPAHGTAAAAELVDGVGRYVAAVLHGVKVRQREAQLSQPEVTPFSFMFRNSGS